MRARLSHSTICSEMLLYECAFHPVGVERPCDVGKITVSKPDSLGLNPASCVTLGTQFSILVQLSLGADPKTII